MTGDLESVVVGRISPDLTFTFEPGETEDTVWPSMFSIFKKFSLIVIPFYFYFVEFQLLVPSFPRQISMVELVFSHLPLVHMRSDGYRTSSVCVSVCYHIFCHSTLSNQIPFTSRLAGLHITGNFHKTTAFRRHDEGLYSVEKEFGFAC